MPADCLLRAATGWLYQEMQHRSAVVLVSSLAALAACATEPSTSIDVSAGIVRGGNGDPCPTTGCGTNSPYLGGREFHELEETGTFENREGFRITGMLKNGLAYRPDVTGTVLVAHRSRSPDLQDQALVGAELLVANAQTAAAFRIKIVAVSHAQTYWQGAHDPIETYELRWRPENADPNIYRPLCANPPAVEEIGGVWLAAKEAILFTGDRYDRETLRVTASTPAEAGTWFNIGCSGNVLSKLVLSRHTSASQSVPTTSAQRQAMLKMYTSDVCGTGQAFTKQGTALRWNSSVGWHNSAPPYPNSEARWGEYGALCLDTHRLHGSVDDMTNQIFAACGDIPSCVGNPVVGYLTTSSPAL